ncbi:ABC transporter permease [Rossellomorea sp. BNER]|jgi:ABC-2 type transport system permease protein|uniref:ABC transporter permease n=1 Tax=Rossellomorea sp. BNER TaxID=2962031 RepID=UPI003AF224DA|nr:ABC transporter permease [Rossellomorea sp. BNER]
MGNLVKTEWYKLKKDRSFWVLTLLLLAFAILYPLDQLRSPGAISTLPSENDYYRGAVLSINSQIVWILPAILAGFFIASEYSMGTMKSIASSGNSRIRMYFAKLIVFSVGSITILLILPIFMMGASALYLGFDAMPEWTFYFQTIGLIALYAAAFASIMAFFSTIFNDSGKAIGFLFLFLLLSPSLLEAVGGKVSFLEPMITRSIFISQGSISGIDQIGHWNGDDVLTFLVVPILTFLIFGILGSFIFWKKEIK